MTSATRLKLNADQSTRPLGLDQVILKEVMPVGRSDDQAYGD